jgi:hypothetical protein
MTMAGIIDSATGNVTAPTTTNATSTDATATGYDASQDTAATSQAAQSQAAQAGLTTNTVDPSQTVAGQLSGIISDDSPLLQQARAQAQANANSRGLLNSSMANTSAESAVLSTALPIAQQDASTNFTNSTNNTNATNQNSQYNATNTQNTNLANASNEQQTNLANASNEQQTGLANQNATNTASQFGANAQNAASSQNAQQDTQTSQFNAQASNTAAIDAMQASTQTYIDSQDNANKVQLQAMDDDNKTQLANIQAQYQELMQSSQSADDIFKSIVGNITTITTDTTMSPQAKQDAVNQQLSMLRSGMAVAGQVGGVDLGNLLNFDPAAVASGSDGAAPAASTPPASNIDTVGNSAANPSRQAH